MWTTVERASWRSAGDVGAMLSVDEVVAIVATGESETLEFKQSTGARKEAARTLSAMLNGVGGTVLFGVRDDGMIVGQQVTAKSLEDLTAACRQIRPEFPPTIERVELGGNRAVLVVRVPSGAAKPYAYGGSYYVRSGASTVDMPAETELNLVLERAHGFDRWEKSGSLLDLEAIDAAEVEAFRDAAIERGRASFEPGTTVIGVLRALNLLDAADGRPNRGAIALFGRRDAFAYHYPMLGCHLVAVDGTDLAETFVDEKLIEENAFVSLRRAIAFCRGHLRTPMTITGFEADTGLEIPEPVLREALANAFTHRSYTVPGHVQVRVYADRVEVVSPGGLHFGLVPEDLYAPHTSMPWNPTMLAAFYRRGLVEQLGSGTLRMVRLCTEAGLGVPRFSATASAVTCALPRAGYWFSPDGRPLLLDEVERVLLAEMAKGPASRGDLAATVGVPELRVRNAVNKLSNHGLAHYTGRGRGARWSLGPEAASDA